MPDLDPAFRDFAETLTAILPVLLHPESPRLRVRYAPNQQNAAFGEILLGLGTFGDHPEDTGVVLQHKGSHQHSVAAYIRNATDKQIQNWPVRPARNSAGFSSDALRGRCLAGYHAELGIFPGAPL